MGPKLAVWIVFWMIFETLSCTSQWLAAGAATGFSCSLLLEWEGLVVTAS